MRKKGEKLKVNQILVTEKLYITPEMKRKKLIYKIELFLSVFLICLLFSYYIYAEYDRNKSEEVSKDILAQIKEQVDDTVKTEDDGKIVVILEVAGAQEEPNNQTETTNKAQTNNASKIDTKTYTSKDGVKYTTEAILKIPKINIEYPVLSATSDALLFVSLNKYWGPKPNEVGNYCIVGHYYENGKMFGKLHKLKNGDTAELTDLTGNTITYQVYDKKVVEPTDTSCTSQLTARNMQKRELTLITCTNGGKQRLVVKLREI
mgnify:FL=1